MMKKYLKIILKPTPIGEKISIQLFFVEFCFYFDFIRKFFSYNDVYIQVIINNT